MQQKALGSALKALCIVLHNLPAMSLLLPVALPRHVALARPSERPRQPRRALIARAEAQVRR